MTLRISPLPFTKIAFPLTVLFIKYKSSPIFCILLLSFELYSAGRTMRVR